MFLAIFVMLRKNGGLAVINHNHCVHYLRDQTTVTTKEQDQCPNWILMHCGTINTQSGQRWRFFSCFPRQSITATARITSNYLPRSHARKDCKDGLPRRTKHSTA